ncbi:epididymal-specific lipocalin-5 [Octodon degus]|uniref:Epididymal-specific lipocalin-5 n=1 Tax=Octodon degus TaxID=10160 RepID=A0A6P6D905_OCTDE|nr:epididymal-specific lipocalin-5 [Octodon degus]
MEGSVTLALLWLCTGLVAASEEHAIKDFDFLKFAGLWYEIAFAVKAGAPTKAPKVEKIGAVMLQLENSSLVLTAAHYEEHCVVEKTTAIKKVVPGTFTIVREGGNKEVRVLGTDYKTYAVMDVHFTMNGIRHQVLKLYSRSLDNNEKALEKFRKVAREHGFQEPDFHLLQRDMACVTALQGSV